MYLYIIKLQEFHKIGITDNPRSRFSQLQTASPFKITQRYIFEFEDASLIEKVLHQRFYPKRSSGEWFLLSERDIDDVVLVCERLGGKAVSYKEINESVAEIQKSPVEWLWYDLKWAFLTSFSMWAIFEAAYLAIGYVAK